MTETAIGFHPEPTGGQTEYLGHGALDAFFPVQGPAGPKA